jgi:hypothetical protein
VFVSDIIEIEDFLPKLQQNELRKLFLTDIKFPWHHQNFSVLDSPEDRKASANDPNIKETDLFSHFLYYKKEQIESNYHEQISLIFKNNIKKKLNIEISEEIRLRVNFNTPSPGLKNTYSTPHVDDRIPHYTMIYYVNDTDGDTYLFKEFADENFKRDHLYKKKTLERCITPKKGKAVIFNGLRYHAAGSPSIDNRIVINYNFIAK